MYKRMSIQFNDLYTTSFYKVVAVTHQTSAELLISH